MITSTPKQSESDPDERADINTLINDVVPDADTWKNTPNPLLGGDKPVDLLGTDRESVLRDMLRAAKHGMVS